MSEEPTNKEKFGLFKKTQIELLKIIKFVF
jgi:hypothetical protein